MSAPETMAEAICMIDALYAELDQAFVDIAKLEGTIADLRAERDTWRAAAGR